VCSDLTTHQRAFSEWAVAINTVMGADGIIYKQELTPDGYCRLMFPAIREETLKHSLLKDTSMAQLPCRTSEKGDEVQRTSEL
jgi:hypothetical protein